MTERTTHVRVDGVSYEIPEIWLAGFCTANRCTVEAAVNWWHHQEQLRQIETNQEAG